MDRLIDVAICTYRRDSLRHTLASIAGQDLPLGVTVRLIVADNDIVPSAQAMVETEAATLGLDCRYIHAPARNISTARNACLEAAKAPLLAFIDDDEVATPGWLTAMLCRLDDSEADAVLGPAIAQYPADAPRWAIESDLHSTRPVERGGRILTGYTCNVMLRTEVFGDLRFDPALGRSGGEDDVFFATAVARGAIIVYAPKAVVDDPVPENRLRLAWLLRRSYRNGQTYARITLSRGGNKLIAVTVAGAKAGSCLALSVLQSFSPGGWRRALVRGALHVGALAGYFGIRELELY